MIQPDSDTLKRLSNLANVGNALYLVSDSTKENTDFFVAKSSLNSFKMEIDMLDLPKDVRIGIQNLIKYLEIKIEKREKQSKQV